MTLVYESPRLRRVCLVCSYERARLAVGVVSARGGWVGGWRFVGRARHVGRGGQEQRRFPTDESRQTFVG